MSPIPQQKRRRTFLVNPRLQVGAALLFTAAVFLGGILFAWLCYRGSREALWAASFQGHFRFETPYQLVGGRMVRLLVVLFAMVTAAGALIFLLFVRRIRAGLNRLCEVLRTSGEGDLSSSTNAPGLRELSEFGSQVDAVRGYTLDQIRGIRAEVEIMRKEPLPQEEFRQRWEGLRDQIGRIVP